MKGGTLSSGMTEIINPWRNMNAKKTVILKFIFVSIIYFKLLPNFFLINDLVRDAPILELTISYPKSIGISSLPIDKR